MLTLKNIKALTVEASSKCIGRCPFCSRGKKIRPYGEHLITLSDFKKLPHALFEDMAWISFAGNFGDFSTNPDMIKIAGYIKSLNPDIKLEGDTNGSVQNEFWWGQLGTFFKDGEMTFALDGLGKTHAIHRVGTKFEKIIQNIKAFTQSGGTAHWKFVLFEHNESQIDEAEKLAEEIGCNRFFVISSREYDLLRKRPKTMNFRLKNEIIESYYEQNGIEKQIATCKPLKNKSLYLAADGTVHPCCLAHCMYITGFAPSFHFISSLIEKYHDQINFKTKPFEEIIQGPYFTDVLTHSISNPYCAMRCNKHRKEIKEELILHDKHFS